MLLTLMESVLRPLYFGEDTTRPSYEYTDRPVDSNMQLRTDHMSIFRQISLQLYKNKRTKVGGFETIVKVV